MIIHQAQFVVSNTDYKKCPESTLPEYAFIGRSNVGKSSLINMLTNHKKLAMTSSKPGKTQLINHFLINTSWHLVDLPGYGYAKTDKKTLTTFSKIIKDYLVHRKQLTCLFVLIDSRHPGLKSDLEFTHQVGSLGIPLAIVMTKGDKLSTQALEKNKKLLENELYEYWETLPPIFTTSSAKKQGRDELLNYIDEINKSL